MESPEMDSHKYSQLLFDKRAKIVSSTNGARCWINIHMQKNKKEKEKGEE